MSTICYLGRSLYFMILPYRKSCCSMSVPCAKAQGVLVGENFQNCLYMADD